MFLCACNRLQLLAFLPKNGVVAEIGTAKGRFAKAIHDVAAPRDLHLIDPWQHQTRGDYVADSNNVDDGRQDRRYREVRNLFAEGIAEGRVVLHRRFSAEAVEAFADGMFDFVYVDGDHSFRGAYGDLTAYGPKIKPDGFLAGHDYSNATFARKQGFDTVSAVNRFVEETDFELILLTLETDPTYVLARPGAALSRLQGQLLFSGVVVAEIEGFPAVGEFVHKQFAVGDRTGVVPTFRMPSVARSGA